MYFKSLLLLGATALAFVQAERCGAHHDAEQRRQRVDRLASYEAKRSAAKFGGANYTNTSSLHVDLYMHSVSANKEKLLSKQDFQRQFNVIADRFKPYNIIFDLKDTSRTIDSTWANGNRTDHETMKSNLRQGDYRSLNLYFVDFIQSLTSPESSLGRCTFPEKDPNESEFNLDGCLILTDTIPGGSETNYSQGLTAVHEIGHWFDLEHTFYQEYSPEDPEYDLETACTDPGDGIADTPAQAQSTTGCPRREDTCKDQPGLDPIHNYMDYSYDRCLNEFTPGQVKRIFKSWDIYRKTA